MDRDENQGSDQESNHRSAQQPSQSPPNQQPNQQTNQPSNPPSNQPDARHSMGKHLMISAARFLGVALIVLGIALNQSGFTSEGIIGGDIAGGKLPVILLIGLGMIAIFALPRWLAKIWRSKE